jgi:hypothetical protein
VIRTEELFASATLLNNLDESRLQLLDRWDVVCKDTHFARLSGNVDLNDIGRLVDGLFMIC